MERGSQRENLGLGGGGGFARRLKRRGFLLTLALLVCLTSGAAFARALPKDKASAPGTESCAQNVWRDATDKPWFYSEAGNLVVPQVNYEWLVVHFYHDPAAEVVATDELPPAVLSVSKLLKEQLADLIYDPALDPDMCMYRLRNPENSSVVAGSVARLPAVHAVRPAYTIGDANVALLNEIDIRWKTQTSEQEKASLLKKASVTPLAEDAGRKQRVRIDPCRSSVWATANLIHEDLHVVSASPALAKIEPPVRATFTVGVNGTTIGAPLPFSLQILFSKRMRIEPATIANLNLCPPEISRQLCKVEYDQPLSAVDVTSSPIRLEGRLYLYGTGEFTLPEVPVYYRQGTSEEAELVITRTPAVPVRIAAVIPQAKGRYQLKVAGVQPLPEIAVADLKTRKIFGISVLAIGAVLFLSCLVVLRRMAIPETVSTPAASIPDVMEKHASVLRRILSAQRDALGSAEIAAFGHAFRGYLGARCGVTAESMGGGAEVFYATLRDRLPVELRPCVQELLESFEAGLSRGQFSAEGIERIFASVRDVLDYYESHESR
jgi:hypothetical protein